MLSINLHCYLPFRDIAIVHKVVNYNAKMVLIQGGSALDWDADTIITGPVNLGDAFRLRVDFEITHPDNRTEFGKHNHVRVRV